MPYFLILPVYLVLLAGLICLAIAFRFFPRLKPMSRYFWGGAIGTAIGFIVANAIVLLVGVMPAWLGQRFTFPNWLQETGRFFVAATLFVGPFIGSTVGVALGFLAGFYFVLVLRTPANAQPDLTQP